MGIDIRSSNRTRFIRCTYYSNKNTKQEVLERNAEKLGIFYADEQGGENNTKQDIGGFVRRDVNSITLVTEDDADLKTDYWVEFDEQLYIVTSVQKIQIQKTRQHSSRPQEKRIIQLRK
jgi:hypothetical protein